MKKIKTTLFILAIGMLGSCTKAIIDPDEETPDSNSDTVTYAKHVEQIMFNNCVTCHGGAAPSAGADLTNYANVKSYTQDGQLLQRINNEAAPMPPSGLMNSTNRQIIQSWADGGYKQ
jgi:mono/diheme cytochrome c family protein